MHVKFVAYDPILRSFSTPKISKRFGFDGCPICQYSFTGTNVLHDMYYVRTQMMFINSRFLVQQLDELIRSHSYART
jgi:hypothetical protein